mgnify:CR=1 FL=1
MKQHPMQQKIESVLNQLNHGLVEREHILKTALLTLLAGENLVLIGPPGTGKTHNTINQALAILAPDFLAQNSGNDPETRKRLKAEFDRFVTAERVRFVTFHQSFSYEDFVEGIRAVTRADGALEYKVEPGVFAKLCERASSGVTSTEDPFEQALQQIVAGHGEEAAR